MSSPATAHDATQEKAREVKRTLKKRGRGKAWAGLLLLAIAGGAAAWWFLLREDPQQRAVRWRTAQVERGDIIMKAIATGNLEPQRTISIGAEVSGRIISVEADFNDAVTQGQVLARFDTEALENSLEQARVQLNATRAGLRRSQIALEDARDNEARLKELHAQGATSARDYTAAQTALRRAQADLDDARAQEKLQKIRVDLAQTNLDRAVITSPVNGVVLKRSVEPGNTVAASLQSPELFLVAEDLAQMELHVGIDEADVGLVQAGQQAAFTVDAWPDRTFDADVTAVHLYPASTEGVVTYTAVLRVSNPDGALRPGMTASATITTQKREGVLRVPNAALRFTPPTDAAAASGLQSLFAGPRPPMRGLRGGGGSSTSSNTLWLLRDDTPQRITVKLGRTDGLHTEILSDEIKEGDTLITGVLRDKAEGGARTRGTP